MTAIWPAGPPKVCSEMANQALVASRSGMTSREVPVEADMPAPNRVAGAKSSGALDYALRRSQPPPADLPR